MKTIALGLLGLALALPVAATPISGKMAIAGASAYTVTGISFLAPAVPLIATGNFVPLLGNTVHVNNLTFATAPGFTLFHAPVPDITMDLLTLTVVANTANFLNITGTADFLEPGFDMTKYVFTLTATRPDDISSFTLTAAPAVPEPAPLFLIGSGLLFLGWLYRQTKRQA